ncbi:Arc family DNA-binding protein [Paracoccus sp. NBH48]|uniref:FitA-like ribbon-helix-helix domain-containing protein n=1 Tax=Paracoccus sp. NBH48 TaxID=2596918 RepID=UPI0018913ED4|nr:Arc family DNA-binding protein [Paracoccus sp. NBH48]
MGNMTVRRIPDHVHDHLRECARSNGRSLEAEVRGNPDKRLHREQNRRLWSAA